ELDVRPPQVPEVADQLGDESLVPGGEAGGADHVNLLLYREARALLGRLEQRAGDDLEAQVGEGRGDEVGAAVVAVLAHLGDQHSRLAPEPGADRADTLFRALPGGIVGPGGAVNTLDRSRHRAVAAEHV